MSNLKGKLHFVVEIKSPAIDFFQIFGTKKNNLAKIIPDKTPVCDLLQGNWGELGCVLSVHYLIDGNIFVSKERIVAVDEENMLVTYDYFEGDFNKLYKSYKFTIQVISNGEKNFMDYTIEYEKQSEDVPTPDNMISFLTEATNGLDAYFVNNTTLAHAS